MPAERGLRRVDASPVSGSRENSAAWRCGFQGMVLPDRIELSTSPLPRECSTTELRQRRQCPMESWNNSIEKWAILTISRGEAQASPARPGPRRGSPQASRNRGARGLSGPFDRALERGAAKALHIFRHVALALGDDQDTDEERSGRPPGAALGRLAREPATTQGTGEAAEPERKTARRGAAPRARP